MAISILLVPVKLIVKALLYVLSAVLDAAAWIVGFPAMLFKNLLAVVGGIGIVGVTTMLILGALPDTDTSSILMYYGLSAGIILFPLVFIAIMKGLFSIRGFLLETADDITILD